MIRSCVCCHNDDSFPCDSNSIWNPVAIIIIIIIGSHYSSLTKRELLSSFSLIDNSCYSPTRLGSDFCSFLATWCLAKKLTTNVHMQWFLFPNSYKWDADFWKLSLVLIFRSPCEALTNMSDRYISCILGKMWTEYRIYGKYFLICVLVKQIKDSKIPEQHILLC